MLKINTYTLSAALMLLTACHKSESEKKYSLNDKIVSTEAIAQSVETPNAAPVKPTEVSIQPVNSVDVDSKLRFSGNVTTARIGFISFNVPGFIEKSNVRIGDSVKKGQPLAVLNIADFLLRERLAKVGFNLAKVNFDQAKKDFEREAELNKEKVTTQSSIERVNTSFQSAKLSLDKAQVDLESAQKALSDATLYAPFNGIISKKLKVEGEYVGVGAPMYEIYDSEQLEVTLKMPENVLSKLKIGKEISVTIPSIDKQATIKINRIVPIISETSRTFDVIGKFNQLDKNVIPGQFVEAQL